MTSTKNGNSSCLVKQSPKINVKPIKIPSENLISTQTISISSPTKNSNNSHFKSFKTRNSPAINIPNNYLIISNGNDNKEYKDKSGFNKNSSSKSNLTNKPKRTSEPYQIKDSKTRRDAKGNPIIKGRKKHAISFKDLLDKNADLVEVVDVESFKEYNAKELSFADDKHASLTNLNNSSINNGKSSDNTSCACIVY